MLTKTNTLQQCHYTGINKLYDVGFPETYGDVISSIVGQTRDILYDPEHPEDFWVVQTYYSKYFGEDVLDLYAVIKQSEQKDFIHKTADALRQYATKHNIKRIVCSSYSTGYMRVLERYNPWGWEMYSASYTIELP